MSERERLPAFLRPLGDIEFSMANGMRFPLFFRELFANRIGAFFGMDVLVSAVTLIVFARREKSRIPAAGRWLVLAILTGGVSFALPLFLYLRERTLESSTA